jgi:RNA polymerase sigma-70 factor (ECF subfamily)
MSHLSRAPDREQTFRLLYEAVYPDLLRFVQRRTERPDHAEDVVADSFLVVWRRFDESPPVHEDARAWIFRIARNILLNTQRGEQRRQALGVRLADAAALPCLDADGDLVMNRVDLGRGWGLLSEVHQEALSLAVFEELTAPQAAAVLNISPVAFRLRLSRARRALRLLIEHLPQPSAMPEPSLERAVTP